MQQGVWSRIKKKTLGVMKDVMQDQKGCKKKSISSEKHKTAAQTKQDEDEEEEYDTGIRLIKTKYITC